MKIKTTNFGEHLTIDGYEGDEALLNDKKLVFECLDTLPNLIGMKKLAPPKIYFTKGNDIKDPGGWSGVVVIMESHISIHTFPKRKFLSADVYSCKNGMKKKFVLDFFKKKFQLKSIESNFIKRGTKYPDQNLI